MKKVLKWVGIVIGGLLVLVVLVVGVGYVRGSAYLTAKHDFELETINIPTDPESIANGKYLATTLIACTGCHGEDFSGQEMINEDGFLILYSRNLTSGEGGIGSTYTDADWVRSLRHGIRPNGENLIVMPAQYISRLSAEDVGDIIAFLKTLPPVDHVLPERKIFFMPRLLIGLGVMPPETVAEIFPASAIDHNATIPEMPAKGVTAEWGQYRAQLCQACHGANYAGRDADPNTGTPAHPNITPGGELVGWTEEDFLQFIRTGITPSGHQVDPEMMPWNEFKGATDDDLKAIFTFLKSLDPLETYTPVGN